MDIQVRHHIILRQAIHLQAHIVAVVHRGASAADAAAPVAASGVAEVVRFTIMVLRQYRQALNILTSVEYAEVPASVGCVTVKVTAKSDYFIRYLNGMAARVVTARVVSVAVKGVRYPLSIMGIET